MGMLLDSVFGFPRVPLQRSYMWDCILPDIWNLGNLAGGGIVGGAADLLVGASVGKFCQNVSFGNYNITDVIEQRTGAFQKFYAGNMIIENPRLSFVAPVPDIISNYFHMWKKRIVDDDGFYSVANEYKKNIHVILYHNTGIPSNMITLKGAFPVRFPAWELSFADTKLVYYEIEFKVDKIQPGEIMDAIVGVASGVTGITGNMF